jgi:hypothetical protein
MRKACDEAVGQVPRFPARLRSIASNVCLLSHLLTFVAWRGGMPALISLSGWQFRASCGYSLKSEVKMMPYLILAALAAVLAVAIAALTFKRFAKDDDEPGGTTAGHAGAMLSALFLLVFAIAVIVPWTVADSAQQNTYAEARSLTEAYWETGDLPPEAKQETRSRISAYTNFVVNREWRSMGDGKLDDEGWKQLDALRVSLNGLELKNKDQSAARDNIVERVKETYAFRRQRGVDAQSSLPAGISILTVLTAVIIIIFPFLAGARPRGMTLLPLLVMSALLGISVYLVFNIEQPFTGGLAVGPDAFTSALREFTRIHTAVP